MRNVPFFNYPHLWVSREQEYLKIIKNVWRRGAFIAQKELTDFEKNIALYTRSKYAIGVANATDGLQLGLMAGGINNDDEVIICSHTMIATAIAVHFAGGKAIPVEAGSDHLIDTIAVENAITKKTKAILPTQLNGRTANMDQLTDICRKYNLLLFEDAAQGLGAKYRGKYAGTFGVASCISFYPAKVLGCFGDGGIVLTNDEEVYQKTMQLRNFGRDHYGNIQRWGYNSRLDNIQAAILDLKLKTYGNEISRRRELAKRYQEQLCDIEQILLPPGPDADPDYFDIYQNYEIEAEQRDELKAYLSDNGVSTLIQWGGGAVHKMIKLGFNQSLPYTEKMFTRLLMLPMNTSIKDDDVDYVCAVIRKFYGK